MAVNLLVYNIQTVCVPKIQSETEKEILDSEILHTIKLVHIVIFVINNITHYKHQLRFMVFLMACQPQ